MDDTENRRRRGRRRRPAGPANGEQTTQSSARGVKTQDSDRTSGIAVRESRPAPLPERVARVTETVVEQFDPDRESEMRALLEPIDRGAGRIDPGEVARRIDKLMSAATWAYDGKIWARQVRQDWEDGVLAIEADAIGVAKKAQGYDLAKNAARERVLDWAIEHLPSRASELKELRRMRLRLADAEKHYGRLRDAFELHRRSMDVLLTQSTSKR